jgi:integral membrane protein
MDASRRREQPEDDALLKPHWTVPALRWTAIVETVSFVALMVAVVLHSERGVSVLGMTHGLLFMAYAALVLAVRKGQGWSGGFTALAIIGGPVAALFVPERLGDPAPVATPEEVNA